VLAARELVVERAPRHAGATHDLLDRHLGVAARGEQLARGGDELGAGAL
jgi:hypothetical protein